VLAFGKRQEAEAGSKEERIPHSHNPFPALTQAFR
jgi:hypothetical protein